MTSPLTPPPANKRWLRKTLRVSQAESVSSAVTAATGDNFFNAFAVLLQASALQLSVLTAFPQLVGAGCQLLSVWMGRYVTRKQLVVGAAVGQALAVAGMAALGLLQGPGLIMALIFLAMFYHALGNAIQPQWRAWMGDLVPARRRGVFFAARTRLHMVTALGVFLAGGWLLAATAADGRAGEGFAWLFGAAALCRLISAALFTQMRDPEPEAPPASPDRFGGTIAQMRASLSDRVFLRYSLFLAGMSGMVAISAPFFALYMLRDLQFSYWQFSLNSVASIVVQFLCLKRWGQVADRYGNRLVLIVCASLLPILPMLWLVSADFYYLLWVQCVSGLAWSGFSLSAANYLYDIRPHRSNFATYAAMQACMSAGFVCVGALLGGVLAAQAPLLQSLLPRPFASDLFVVFLASGLLRLLVTLWFIPRSEAPNLRHRPELLRLILRVARYTPLSGIVLDWTTVERRPNTPSGSS